MIRGIMLGVVAAEVGLDLAGDAHEEVVVAGTEEEAVLVGPAGLEPRRGSRCHRGRSRPQCRRRRDWATG